MTKQEIIILPDTPEAAICEARTLTGWWDRHGNFHGDDERAARYQGSTHGTCSECGAVKDFKAYTKCRSCRDKSNLEKQLAFPVVPWVGQCIYCDTHDEWVFDGDIEEHMASTLDSDPSAEECLCLAGERMQYSEFDESTLTDDYCVDDGSDPDIAPEIEKAVKALNEALHAHPPNVYQPTGERVDVSEEWRCAKKNIESEAGQ